ncbi:conserved hypothetical protein [Candida tropicalis MYA-3404]|uniref:Uncharacterized protein n=1 Tax=Candida tropicalis (strain ATCC MYA-3404 / T1) TaxID=294747 RepID=C5MDE9_CANTT|nr:conserved hypothetical protein [Candida tropicalis MYA-3404]EER32579.1 conserved hypothetical protein [Candida tropicalis MYA-3404]KAG4406204.1 hypothetical protein JTP64_005075 [Candida tropicalis]
MKSSVFASSTPQSRKSNVSVNMSKENGSTSTSSKRPNNVSWNLEEMMSTYMSSGALPPLLSPTIPDAPFFNLKDEEDEEIVKEEKPKERPVPKQEAQLKAPRPSYPKIKKRLQNDIDSAESSSDDESVIRQLKSRKLSPTLPPMFENTPTPINNGQPDESSISTPANSSFTNKPTKVGTFKWINKLNDPAKPKFLLRFTVNNKLKYKKFFVKPASPSKLSGFKIHSTNGQSPAPPKVIINDTEKQEFLKEKERLEKEITKLKDKQEQFTREQEAKERKLSEQEQSLKQLEKSLLKKEKELQDSEFKLKQSPPSESDQKLRNQLQRLTQDIMKKGQNEDDTKRLHINNFKNQASLDLSRGQRDEIKEQLSDKKNHWFQLSKSAQGKADDCRKKDELLSIVIQVDAFLLRMVSNDYDERSKIVSGVLPSERSWKILDRDISEFIERIEDLLKHNIKDKIFADFCKILNCILFQTRALILKRINEILLSVIQSYIDKKNSDLNGKIIELQQLSLNNNNTIIEHFMNSNPAYLNAVIPVRFPITWFNKCLDLDIPQKAYNLADFKRSVKPSLQLYYLPFGNYTNLNELTAFLFSIMKEFIDIYNKFNSASAIMYPLQSGQQ